MINLYNFMDGIDGLAGGEAVLVASVGGLGLIVAGQPGLGAAALAVAGASAGFLVFNWAPARIFMGDVGSGLLGFLLAGLGLASEAAGGPAALTWVLWLGVFVVDATITLIRRFLGGEAWYAAHSSHAYQRAVQSGWSHARVSAVALILTAALAGLGWAAERRPSFTGVAWTCGVFLLLIAYLSVERRRPMPREDGAG
jgi:Fuc2NAc and GlcNAc transferase